MRDRFATGLRVRAILVALGAVLGATGCTGPRYDSARYTGNQAIYAVNPKCADEFSPCQDGTAP